MRSWRAVYPIALPALAAQARFEPAERRIGCDKVGAKKSHRMTDSLLLILTLLAAAVIVVALCRVLRLTPILGYLAVGIAIGPHALAWIPDTPQTRYLAEFGIVFLMFSIGLEFSL